MASGCSSPSSRELAGLLIPKGLGPKTTLMPWQKSPGCITQLLWSLFAAACFRAALQLCKRPAQY